LYYRLNTVPIFVPPLRERGTDIELLFRKFTTDFAERYRIKPLQLTEPAKQLLLRFPFPGNIRQLKNLAEQISILESEQSRPIEPEVLSRYLPQPQQPQHTNRMPMVFPQGGHGTENYSERELLYKVLFDMRRDMTELKKLVGEMLGNEQYGRQILNNHKDLFETRPSDNYAPTDRDGSDGVFRTGRSEPDLPLPRLLPPPESARPYEPIDDLNDEDDAVQEAVTVEDITHETEEDSLSLEKKEKEMIVKALRRNNNKRKYAAQALGISERTLYRKIKQYEIDENQ